MQLLTGTCGSSIEVCVDTVNPAADDAFVLPAVVDGSMRKEDAVGVMSAWARGTKVKVPVRSLFDRGPAGETWEQLKSSWGEAADEAADDAAFASAGVELENMAGGRRVDRRKRKRNA